jgi:hypothetical protein
LASEDERDGDASRSAPVREEGSADARFGGADDEDDCFERGEEVPPASGEACGDGDDDGRADSEESGSDGEDGDGSEESGASVTISSGRSDSGVT